MVRWRRAIGWCSNRPEILLTRWDRSDKGRSLSPAPNQQLLLTSFRTAGFSFRTADRQPLGPSVHPIPVAFHECPFYSCSVGHPVSRPRSLHAHMFLGYLIGIICRQTSHPPIRTQTVLAGPSPVRIGLALDCHLRSFLVCSG